MNSPNHAINLYVSGVIMDTWLAILHWRRLASKRRNEVRSWCSLLGGGNRKQSNTGVCKRCLWLSQWRMVWGQIKQQVDHRHLSEIIPQNSRPTFILKYLCQMFQRQHVDIRVHLRPMAGNSKRCPSQISRAITHVLRLLEHNDAKPTKYFVYQWRKAAYLCLKNY